ncbi:hypothetical protein FACS1894102_0390 [Spirochaetia bacterium]|nr:hypothetical protein FACS1894102_0390 [Spirochaetia bacterium]
MSPKITLNNDTNTDSLLMRCIQSPKTLPRFYASALNDPLIEQKQAAWDFYIKFGHQKQFLKNKLSDEDRFLQLYDRLQVYFKEDIYRLTKFRTPEPFVKLYKCIAMQTAQLVNADALASETGVSIKTVQRYLRYFKESGKVILLSAWFKNINKRLVKTSRMHFVDNGILQTVLQKRGGLTSSEYQSAVNVEIHKQILNSKYCAGINFYHVCTYDGTNVDLLLEIKDTNAETSCGYFAFKIKMTDKIRETDARHLKILEEVLDKPLRHGFILSNDITTRQITKNITAINTAYFLI